MKKIVVLIFCLGLLPLFGCTKSDMKNGAVIIKELKSNGISVDTAVDNSSSILSVPGGGRFHTFVDNADYNLASVVGIITFILCATLSILVYTRTKSYKEGAY